MNILKNILLPIIICAIVLLNLAGCGTKGKKPEKQATEQTSNETPTDNKSSSDHPDHPTDNKSSNEHPSDDN